MRISPVLGLNLDYPLLLSTVIEHAATAFGERRACVAQLGRRRCAAITAAPPYGAAGWLRPCAAGPAGRRVRRFARLEHTPAFRTVLRRGRCRRVLHTANPRLPPEQILYTINFTGYRTLFIDVDTVALAEQLAPRLATVERFIIMAARDDMPATNLPNVLCYEDLIDAGDPSFAWPALDERRRARCASPPARPANRRACCIRIAVPCCRRSPPAAATAGRLSAND